MCSKIQHRGNAMLEEWKDIKGYEGYYQVSDCGKVRSLNRIVKHGYSKRQAVKGRVRKNHLTLAGYLTITLSREAKYEIFAIHRLIGLHFIKNPKNKKTINHIDGNKLNNCVDNLEWATHSENTLHAYKLGMINNTGCSHKKVIQYDLNGVELNRFKSMADASRETGISRTGIIGCCSGRYETSGNCRWKVEEKK